MLCVARVSRASGKLAATGNIHPGQLCVKKNGAGDLRAGCGKGEAWRVRSALALRRAFVRVQSRWLARFQTLSLSDPLSDTRFRSQERSRSRPIRYGAGVWHASVLGRRSRALARSGALARARSSVAQVSCAYAHICAQFGGRRAAGVTTWSM